MSDTPVQGGCLCGAVRYTIAPASALGLAEACHCSRCRRGSGSAASAHVVVEAAALQVDGLQALRTWQASPRRQRQFCGNCGSPLFIRRAGAEHLVVLAMGSLDGEPPVRLQRHVFCDSAAGWDPLRAGDEGPGDGLPRYRIYPGCEPDD